MPGDAAQTPPSPAPSPSPEPATETPVVPASPQGSPRTDPSASPRTPVAAADAERTLALSPQEISELVGGGAATQQPRGPGSAGGGRGRARGAAFRYTTLESYEEGGYLTKPIREKATKNHEADGVRIGMCGMQGWRKTMEDAHCVVSEDGVLFVGVFDGHCGDQAASLVSETLPAETLSRCKATGVRSALRQAFAVTDSKCVAALDAMPCGAGCTAIAMVSTGDGHVGCAWAGDARAVMSRAGKAVPLSYDHKPQGDREQRRIVDSGGSVKQGRVSVPGAQGTLAVARAFGDGPFKRVQGRSLSDQPISALADVTVAQLCPDDEFVVLACDGIWDRLTDQQCVSLIHERLADTNDLAAIGADVCERCLAPVCPGKGCDNMTIAIVALGAFTTRAVDPTCSTTSEDLRDQWSSLQKAGDMPAGVYVLAGDESEDGMVQARSSLKPADENDLGRQERSVMTLSTTTPNNAGPPSDEGPAGPDEESSAEEFTPARTTVKPQFPPGAVPNSVPRSPAVPPLPFAAVSSARMEEDRRKLGQTRVVCAVIAGFAAVLLVCDAVRGGAVGAATYGAAALLCGVVCAYLFRAGRAAPLLVESIFGCLVLWAVATDICTRLAFDLWMLTGALLASMLCSGSRLIVVGAAALVAEVWMVLRTAEEADTFGLWADLPSNGLDDSDQPEFLGGGRGWEWGVAAMISRQLLLVLMAAVGYSGGGQLRSAVDRAKKATRLCEDVLEAVTVLDVDALQELEERGDVSRVLRTACSRAAEALRKIKAFVPDGAMAGEGRPQRAMTARRRSTNSSEASGSDPDVAWGSSDGSSNSSSNGRRRSTPRAKVPLSPRADMRGQSFVHRNDESRLRSKRASFMMAEVDLERIDTRELSTAVHHFCCNVVECGKIADSMVLHIAGAHVLLSWNSHRATTNHQAQAYHCGTSVADYLRGLTDMGGTITPRPWWSVSLTSGFVSVGITGSSEQRQPVALGAPVVVAMHLGQLSRSIGVYVTATEQVYQIIRSHTFARPVDVIKIPHSHLRPHNQCKGKTDVVYELLGKEKVPSNTQQYVEAFCALQTLKLDDAREKFLQCLSGNRNDRQAQRLLRITVWLARERPSARQYCRELVGWEDLEANSEAAALDDKVAAAVGRGIAADDSDDEDPISSTTWSAMDPRRRKKESVQHDKVLRRQIREAEALHNADQLVAWGLMPDKPQEPTDDGGKNAVPVKFTDHRDRVWCRAQRCLGKGAFGEVFLGMGSEGGLVAIKTMRLPMPRLQSSSPVRSPNQGSEMSAAARRRLARKRQQGGGGGGGGDGGDAGKDMKVHLSQIEDLLREVGLMHKLKHENIVQYLTSAVVNGYIMIVMEFLSGGSLSDVLNQFGGSTPGSGLPLSSIQRYTRDIVSGLAFLHSNEIIHRDMKPHNVLLLVEGQCKLADFGASAQLNQLAQSNQGVIGTPLYMAPEAARGAACEASDVWGLGCIFCQLFSGQVPYKFTDDEPFNPHTFLFKLANNPDFSPTVPPHLPPDARDFVTACLRKEPDARTTAEQLKRVPFLVS